MHKISSHYQAILRPLVKWLLVWRFNHVITMHEYYRFINKLIYFLTYYCFISKFDQFNQNEINVSELYTLHRFSYCLISFTNIFVANKLIVIGMKCLICTTKSDFKIPLFIFLYSYLTFDWILIVLKVSLSLIHCIYKLNIHLLYFDQMLWIY
jgi:hypothetical protein